MPDNLKKKKLDRKRIALGQKHEVQYLRRICRELIELIDSEKKYVKGSYIHYFVFMIGKGTSKRITNSTLKKICEAFLKLSKKR